MNNFVNLLFFIISLTFCGHLFVFGGRDFVTFILDYKVNNSDAEADDPLNAALTDVGLILLFIVQHKLMRILEQILSGTFVEPLYRSIYVLGVSCVLQFLVACWSPVQYTVWDFTTYTNDLAAHYFVISWLKMFVPCLLLGVLLVQLLLIDLPLLVGVKQTYYQLKGLGNPLYYVSPALRRYLGNVHHPILALLFVLWLRPYMSVDRFILACGLTAFASQSSPDDRDIAYVQIQTKLKINY